MVECIYETPLRMFETQGRTVSEPVVTVPLLSGGQQALMEFNESRYLPSLFSMNAPISPLVAVKTELGLALDEQDIDMYLSLFREIGRDPTNIELFDLAQSNSEHSR